MDSMREVEKEIKVIKRFLSNNSAFGKAIIITTDKAVLVEKVEVLDQLLQARKEI